MRLRQALREDPIGLGAALSRRLCRLRGFWRLAEPFRRYDARRRGLEQDRWAVAEGLEGDVRLKVDRASRLGSLIYWRGAHSRPILRFLARTLDADMVLADVGANLGEITAHAAKTLARGKVMAFEPASELRRQLCENVALNGLSNVSVHPWALGDAAGRRPLYGSLEDGGLATLYPDLEPGPAAEEVEVRTFDAAFADSGLRRLDVVKIDAEGAEPAILRGAEAALARHRPLLIVELNARRLRAAGSSSAALLAQLHGCGYRVSLLHPSGRPVPLPRRLPELCDLVGVPCTS